MHAHVHTHTHTQYLGRAYLMAVIVSIIIVLRKTEKLRQTNMSYLLQLKSPSPYPGDKAGSSLRASHEGPRGASLGSYG